MIHIQGQSSNSKLTNVQDQDVQPNAVDLRLGKVFRIASNTFTLTEDIKIHRGSTPVEVDIDGFFNLEPGAYEVIMENTIEVADDEAGWVITRSTLGRNGCFIVSGLYDSGYKGVMAGVLHVTTGHLKIKPGTRIGQYLNFKAESLKSYNGSYGFGTEHDKKYV